MRAGTLRKRIQILAVTRTQDGYGEPVETWATVATVWGQWTPLVTQTREAFAAGAGQMSARQSMQARIRHREGLAAGSTRLATDGQTMEVEAVMDPDGRGRELVVMGFLRG